MAEDPPESTDRIPEGIRDLCTRLRQDVAILHLKWSSYLELFGSPERAALLSETARACFQIIDESLRNDIILSICRLSDPSRTLGGDNVSLATLVARCSEIPRVEDLLMAFQAACGPIRRYRNRHLGHNDPAAVIRVHEDPLPDVARPAIDEILRLAGGILRAVYEHYSAGDPGLRLEPIGGAGELISWLERSRARAAERGCGLPRAWPSKLPETGAH
jgi:hypothetical protein